MRYQFIQTQRAQHRLTRLCQTLGVSRSGYYAWHHRAPSVRTAANARLVERMQHLHRQTKARYGAVKLWRALLAAGVRCGRHRVARLRRVHGIEARRARRFRVVLEQHQFAPPAPNRLHQVFVAPAPNRIWAGDLTAIATRAGWMYLAVILDLYSRRVIGWAMSLRPDQHLALKALQMALTHRRPQSGLIHHTDQGATYTSVAYQRQLRQTGLVASMSRKGNCFDNAVVESFFSTLKNELIHEQVFHTREEAQAAVFEFIEIFYNRQRLHQTLGYVSPVQFEAAHVP
jgi:putative transposase